MDLAAFVTAIINSTSCFSIFIDQFTVKVSDFSPKEKGDAFEWFAKAYFLSHSKMFEIDSYHTRLDENISEDLGMSTKDVGSDSIIIHTSGELSLVQIKYRRPGFGLMRESVTGMAAESRLRPEIRVRDLILFSNVFNPPKNLDEREMKELKFILRGELEETNWNLLKAYLSKNVLKNGKARKFSLTLPKLRDWQVRAVEYAFENGANLGKVQIIAACGSGKTRCMREIIALKNKRAYFYQKVLICVPNLHLLSQWFEVLASSDPEREFLLVGSDVDVDKDEKGYYPKYHLTTSENDIAEFWVKEKSSIVISTYQSLDKIIKSRVDFDLAIADEAHLCCSSGKRSNFNLIAEDDFPAVNIVYTTATPKIFKTTEGDVLSMDDHKKFGRRFSYSFRRAIEDSIVNDYKMVVGVGFNEQKIVESDIDMFEANFLVQSFERHNLKNCLVFSSCHYASRKLYNETKRLIEDKNLNIKCALMSPRSKGSDKTKAVLRIEKGERIIVFNVRVFGLGSDLPSLESVMLTQGQKGVIQTVQSVSRCLRKQKGKLSKILVPCLLEDENDLESGGGFKELRRFLSALGNVDEAIVEELVAEGRVDKRRVTFDLVIQNGKGNNQLNKKLDSMFETKMFQRVAGCNAGPLKKFNLLKEYCTKFDRLPGYSEPTIGWFLGDMLKGRFQQHNDISFNELKSISKNLEVEINARMAKRGVLKSKPSASEKYEKLKEYCIEFGSLPKRGTVRQGIEINRMMNRLLKGSYKKDNKKWLSELKSISKRIATEIESKIAKKEIIKRKYTSDDKFVILRDYCSKFDSLPSASVIYKEVKVGRFLEVLMKGENLLNKREDWLDKLRNTSDNIRILINSRLTTQGSRKGTVDPQKKFETLKEYCTEVDDIPTYKHVYKKTNIGKFFTSFLSKKGYKSKRNGWIEELKTISEKIKLAIDAKLLLEENRMSTSKTFEFLKEYCIRFDRLPKDDEKYLGVNIGGFSYRLFIGKLYLKTRDGWINQLRSISGNLDSLVSLRLQKEAQKKLNPSERRKKNKSTPNNNKSTKIRDATKRKLELLEEYCRIFKRVPRVLDTYEEENIGTLFQNILQGNSYRNQRVELLDKLCLISSSICDSIHSRAKHYP